MLSVTFYCPNLFKLMMNNHFKYSFTIITFLALIVSSCKKDDDFVESNQDLTKWEVKFLKVSGNYKVYDTLFNYLYDMEIVHERTIDSNGFPWDTLLYNNFNNAFNLRAHQMMNESWPTNWPEMRVKIGSYHPTVDFNGHSWQLYGFEELLTDNVWNNDTINIHFKMNNIAYWPTDLVPYYECDCRQIAVRQN